MRGFDNFILAGEIFAEALRNLETCLSVNLIFLENYSHQ